MTELRDHLIIALDENYINTEEFKAYDIKINSALALLNGYINYLKKRKDSENNTKSN